MITYWWFSIFRPQDWVYIDITSLRIPLLATVLFFLGSLFRRHLPKINDPLSFLMVFYFCLGILSNILVGCSSQYKLIDPLQYLGLLLIAILLSIDITNTEKKLVYLIGIVSLSLGFYAGKAGIVSIMSGGASNYGASSLGGTFSGSNAFAMGTATILFFLVFLYQQLSNPKTLESLPKFITTYKKYIQILLLITIVGSVFNIISLFSRGSAIATFLGFCIFLLFRKNKIKIGFILAPIAAIALSFVPIPDGYQERIASAFVGSDKLDSSAASRPFFWQVAKDMVADNPLGVGPGCYREYYIVYANGDTQYGLARDVHSSHFQALADVGYSGLVIWLLMFMLAYKRLFWLMKQVKKNEKNLENPLFYTQCAQMLFISQTIFAFGGSFYTLTYSDQIWLIWGMIIILTKLFKKELKNITEKSKK